MKDIRLEIATDESEREIIKNHKSVDDLVEAGYWFWNWEKEEFENDFMCEDHINENLVAGLDPIRDIANQEDALIATVIDSAPLIIEEGIHYCNRYGYIVYKGAKLEEDYYI